MNLGSKIVFHVRQKHCHQKKSCQRLSPCPLEPMPVSSELDLLLDKVKAISDCSRTSRVTYLRSKKVIAQKNGGSQDPYSWKDLWPCGELTLEKPVLEELRLLHQTRRAVARGMDSHWISSWRTVSCGRDPMLAWEKDCLPEGQEQSMTCNPHASSLCTAVRRRQSPRGKWF